MRVCVCVKYIKVRTTTNFVYHLIYELLHFAAAAAVVVLVVIVVYLSCCFFSVSPPLSFLPCLLLAFVCLIYLHCYVILYKNFYFSLWRILFSTSLSLSISLSLLLSLRKYLLSIFFVL